MIRSYYGVNFFRPDPICVTLNDIQGGHSMPDCTDTSSDVQCLEVSVSRGHLLVILSIAVVHMTTPRLYNYWNGVKRLASAPLNHLATTRPTGQGQMAMISTVSTSLVSPVTGSRKVISTADSVCYQDRASSKTLCVVYSFGFLCFGERRVPGYAAGSF